MKNLIKYIRNIGFIRNENSDDFFILYDYGNKRIGIHVSHGMYSLYNGDKWCGEYEINYLKPLENNFMKELRSFKLKKILN